MQGPALEIPDSCLTSMNIHPDTRLLSLAGRRTSVLVSYTHRDLCLCQRILDEDPDEDFLCTELLVAGDVVYLVLGGSLGTIKVLNASRGLFFGHMKAHGGAVTAIRRYNNRYILSCSEDTTIKMWDVLGLRCVCIFGGYMGHRDCVLSMDVSADLRLLASGGTDCMVNIWDIPQTHDGLRNIHTPVYSSQRIHTSRITCLRFYGDLLVSCSGGSRISVVLPIYSTDMSEDAMFIGEVRTDTSMLHRFEIHNGLLLALAETGRLLVFDMENIAHPSSPVAVEIPVDKKIRDFALCRDRLFVLLEDSSVVAVDMDLDIHRPQEKQ